jgi:hypothetical protein
MKMKWWYWMLEGESIFSKIERCEKGKIIAFYPCILEKSRIQIGRSIRPEDCILN